MAVVRWIKHFLLPFRRPTCDCCQILLFLVDHFICFVKRTRDARRLLDLLCIEVRMLQGFACFYSILRVHIQEFGQKVESDEIEALVHFFVELKSTGPIFSQDLLIFFAFKNGPTKQQVVKNEPSRKDITDRVALRRHIFNVNNFRCYKPRRPTSHEEVFFLVCIGRQSEITDR